MSVATLNEEFNTSGLYEDSQTSHRAGRCTCSDSDCKRSCIYCVCTHSSDTVQIRKLALLLAMGKRVYVHCTAGIDRATLTVVGYLTFVKV